MRLALCCAALALNAGCSTVSSIGDAWTWSATGAPPAEAIPAGELAALNARVTELQARRNGIRSRIASESDIWVRQDLYRDLHAVGLELSPLERKLSQQVAAR